jgi:hypothetical protein
LVKSPALPNFARLLFPSQAKADVYVPEKESVHPVGVTDQVILAIGTIVWEYMCPVHNKIKST